MLVLLVLIGELLLLLWLSKWLTRALFTLLLTVFRQRGIAVSAISLILFPGTVVHELAHLFTAEILGVHTGKLNLVPENIGSDSVRSGSVTIAQTGPFRRMIIGLAPIFSGVLILSALSWWLPDLWQNQNKILISVVFYFIFTVSNSMFASSEDLRGVISIAGGLLALLALFWLAGIRFSLTGQALIWVNQLMTLLVKTLGIVLSVNLAILLVTKLLLALFDKIKRPLNFVK